MPDAGMARREFLRRAAVAAGAALTVGTGCSRAAPAGKARIAQVHDARATGENAYQQSLVDEMLEKGMTAFTGKGDAKSAWASLFKPEDVVGVKINCLFGPNASTHPEVTNAVIKGLRLAGVPDGKIIVWDRTDTDLMKTGYSINRDGAGALCYGTGNDYEPEETRSGSFHGRLSRILTETCTALVNVPILKDHGTSGVTFSMKNHYGSFHNPGDHHGNNCDPYIADLNALPAIKDKTRLIVCDVIRPLANGGPGLAPNFLWDCGMMMVGTDPVALDYVGWQILEARRKEIGLRTFEAEGRLPKWIASAAERGVGTNDPNQIEVVRV